MLARIDSARSAGIDLRASLRRHEATRPMVLLGDGVVTGATGTNVNDLKLLLVAEARAPS